MSETKVYNVGDEVALLDIGENDGFFDLRSLLSGLVGKVKDYRLVCKEGVEYYVGAMGISFSLDDILKRDPTYTDGDTEDEPNRCYYYFANAQVGPVELAFDPRPEVKSENIESFIAVVDEIKTTPKANSDMDVLDVTLKGINPNRVVMDEFVNVPPRPHNHYFKDVSHLKTIDVYRVLNLFEVDNPCIQHAVKKLLVAGGRGAKDFERDLREACDSINRALQMIAEDENSFSQVETPTNTVALNVLMEWFPSVVHKRLQDLKIANFGQLKQMYIDGKIVLIDSPELFDLRNPFF